MTKTRSADFDLATELAKPSFTPAQKDAAALVELVVKGEEPAAGRAAIALGKLGGAGRIATLARLDGPATSSAATETSSPAPARSKTPYGSSSKALLSRPDEAASCRLVVVLGYLAKHHDVDARAVLIARMADASTRVRRAAIGALGKVGGDEARAAVIARWDVTDIPIDERRTLAEALGKLGGEQAIARLAAAADDGDSELARRRDRGLLMAERDASRGDASAIRIDVTPPKPLAVRLGCKPGLGGLLGEELTALGIEWRRSGERDDAVALTLARPWSTLHASRLWATAAIELPFAWSGQGLTSEARDSRPRIVDREDRVEDPEALASSIARAITSADTRALLAAWTDGAIRWRLGFARGHKRSIVWRVAKVVSAEAPDLLNDPSDSTWEFTVDEIAGTLDLVPKRAVDPRFAWRVAEVPAASHPAVAAALVQVAGIRPGDRVWDPFCGSGLELVECARRGGKVIGSDLDPAAIAAARANCDAAGVTAELGEADARTHAPGPVAAIVTNPPLGSRIKLDAGALLVECLPNLARQLAPGGRLVWITPAPRRTTPVADRLGLHRTRSIAVDLGGVRGAVERWDHVR